MQTNLSQIKFLITFALLLFFGHSAAYTYSTCLVTEYLNTANLACTACPTNQMSNNYQTVATACQCQAGYRLPSDPNANACTAAFSTICATPSTSYYPLLTKVGASTTGTANCIACAATAYPNR